LITNSTAKKLRKHTIAQPQSPQAHPSREIQIAAARLQEQQGNTNNVNAKRAQALAQVEPMRPLEDRV